LRLDHGVKLLFTLMENALTGGFVEDQHEIKSLAWSGKPLMA
jgi:hypothetical protein